LSHSLTEKRQRKKIIDDHDQLCSEIEISKLLSSKKIFKHRYQFQRYTIDVCTNFQKLFQRRNFFYCLCLNSSVYRYGYVQKHKLINSNQNQKTESKRKRNKRKNIYIIYKGSYQAKYLFRAWPFTR
jgi:hypothetical protein